MAENPGAVLVAEIGSLLTRVTLIDQVDGESRMVGHAETSSSVEAPFQNALYAVLEATAQISDIVIITAASRMQKLQKKRPMSATANGS